jgi:hypothetical protein
MLQKIIITLFLLFSFSLSYAGSGSFTVRHVGISSTTNTVFFDVNEAHDDSECSDKNTFRFEVGQSTLYKEVYATLLTAFVAKKTITIVFSDSLSECIYNAPQISSVFIR